MMNLTDAAVKADYDQSREYSYEIGLAERGSMPEWDQLTEAQREFLRENYRKYRKRMDALGEGINKGTDIDQLMKQFMED